MICNDILCETKGREAEITIQSKEELDIYMNPQRQRILKCMELKAIPMTPKQISDELGISPSSVTFHIKKLLEIGVVELDHTEMVRGICAKYYRRIPVQVKLRSGDADDLQWEKGVLLDYIMGDVWKGFRSHLKASTNKPDEQRGDAVNGVVYLSSEEASELMEYIYRFLKEHGEYKKEAIPWEVALVAYPREEV